MDLSDSYIPYQEVKFVHKKLSKLPLAVLCQLVLEWASKYGTRIEDENGALINELNVLLRKNTNRRILVSRTLLKYWPNGLCLYQLAQIDCYLLIYKPNQCLWIASTARNAEHTKEVLYVDFDRFVSNLRLDLQKFYYSNIHTFKHPELSLIICRIQLFDHTREITKNHSSIESFTNKSDKLISRRPFYVAFSLNSPHIIHSVDDDASAQLILQSVERTLSYRTPLILERNNISPMKSLKSMQLLYGVSRSCSSLGPWSTYSDTSFDISPLGITEDHASIKGKQVLLQGDMDDHDEQSDSDDSEIREIKRLRLENGMMRFKGKKEGIMDKKLDQARRIESRIHNMGDNEIFQISSISKNISRYSSLIPVEKIRFELHDTLGNGDSIQLKIKLIGNDVFGGLHELCDKQRIDINKVPGWLTGENGPYSGSIVNGDFIKEERGGLI